MKKLQMFLLTVLLFCCDAGPAAAQNKIVTKTPQGLLEESTYSIIPFAFYNKLLQFAVGGAVSAQGVLQDQLFGQLSVIGSSNGSFFAIFKVEDFRLPFSNRLFLSSRLYGGTLGKIEYFKDVNPDFPQEISGSNESDVDNFQEASGEDFDISLKFRYLLPIGHGRGDPVARIVLENGILVEGQTGGDGWHPFSSGRTFFEVNPFFRSQQFTSDASGDFEVKTSGLTFGLIYDNTDFSENPSRGSYKKVAFSKDWGKLGSSRPWESIEFEYAKFFNLGHGAKTRQRVLAFNFWTAHALTWNDFEEDSQGNRTFLRPPNHKGSRLGGIERLKGFAESRFSDRSAIYYSLEYRHIPTWNPFGRRQVLGNTVDLSWFQFVGFAELGRVAPEWDLGTLHKDMKWDAGVGLRVWVNNILTRLDIGYSSEGAGVQMTIEHPFPSTL